MKTAVVVLVLLVVVLGVLVLAQGHPVALPRQPGHLSNFRNAARMQEKQAQRTAIEQPTEQPPQ